MGKIARIISDIGVVEKEVARVASAYAAAKHTQELNAASRNRRGRSRRFLVKNEKWVVHILQKERENRKSMQQVSPEQWRRRIDTLNEPLRTKVACLIWWDFFSGRQVTDRWPHLDDLVANHSRLPDDFNRNDLVIALCNTGYSPYEAAKRISGEDHE